MEERIVVWGPGASLEGEFIGVIFERLPHEILHVGICYRTDAGPTMLHLWGHQYLKSEGLKAGQLCILCDIDPIAVPAIRGAFRRIYRQSKQQEPPFGFSAPHGGWFAANGLLQIPEGALGLCCQSFVVAAFEAAGFPLIDLTTIPARDDDAADQQKFLESLADILVGASAKVKAHYEQVAAAVGQPLPRPEEVAGAAWAEGNPCDFATANRLGKVLLARLQTVSVAAQVSGGSQ